MTRLALALAVSIVALNAGLAPAEAATVNRTGKIKVVVNIAKKSDFTLPIRCEVRFSHTATNRSFSEQMSRRGRVIGNTGLCIVLVPYKWVGADDAQPVSVSFNIGYDSGLNNEIVPPASPPGVRRTSTQQERIPLPLDGRTTLLTYNIDM